MARTLSGKRIIPKDILFIITSGAYSDYNVMTICRATTDVNIDSMQDEYLSAHPRQREECEFKSYGFANWLINNKKVAKEVNYWEYHLSDWGSLDEGFYLDDSPRDL